MIQKKTGQRHAQLLKSYDLVGKTMPTLGNNQFSDEFNDSR